MSAIKDYHDALAHFLDVKASQTEDSPKPDAALTQAEWAVERTFQAAVKSTIDSSLRGAF